MLVDLIQEAVRIEGPRGPLAGALAYTEDAALAACLLVNPHPHMGGRMSNNLIARLAAELPSAGLIALRFDYAGVGESPGEPIDLYASMARFWATDTAPEDPLMIEDARAAAGWLRSQAGLPVGLVGYSFGAYAAASIADADTIGLAMISPTLTRHDFSTLAACAAPKLVVYSDDDFATPADATQRWAGSLPNLRGAHRLAGGNHFFRGQEDRVADLCRRFFAECAGGSP
ncbi:MAG: hypothetical protein HRF43_01795 [Phycisphaerae bacterium]|jgi:alpha/beta superfamily hydrolase